MSKLVKLASRQVQERVKLCIGKLNSQSDNISDLNSFLSSRLAGKNCEVEDSEFVRAVESIEKTVEEVLRLLSDSEAWIDAISEVKA